MSITNPQLAQQIADVVEASRVRDRQIHDWASGSASGGPQADGRFPIQDYLGNTFMIDSPARLSSLVNGLVNSSSAHKDDAEAAANTATTAAGTATTQAGLAADSEDASKAARDAAVVAQNAAENAAVNALAQRLAAENARDLAQLWASEDEDEEVAPGLYSALHWAAKAATDAADADASAGAAADSASAAASSAAAAAAFDPALYRAVADPVPWADLSNLPAFATRWPSWGEVTGKPSVALDAEVVKLTGDQSIAGTKTFTDQVRTWGGGTFPIEMRGTSSQCIIDFRDNAGTRFGFVGFNGGRFDVQQNNTTEPFRFRNSSGTAVEFSNSGTMLVGTVPWARLSDVPNFALDNEVVKLTGDQTISGTKTFTVGISSAGTSATRFRAERTDNNVNSNMEFATAAGSVHAGVGASNHFDIGPDANLNSSSVWRVRLSNGRLIRGEVPWERLSNVPSTFPPLYNNVNSPDTYAGELPTDQVLASFFYHSTGGAPSDSPNGSQTAGVHVGTPWGRFQLAATNSLNRVFYRSGTRTSWEHLYSTADPPPWSAITGKPDLALDDEVVKLTGNQTVRDRKTFTDQVRTWGGGTFPIEMRGNATQCLIEMNDDDGSRLAFMGANAGRLDFLLNNTSGPFRFRNSSGTAFEFNNSGTMTEGTVPWARLSSIPEPVDSLLNTVLVESGAEQDERGPTRFFRGIGSNLPAYPRAAVGLRMEYDSTRSAQFMIGVTGSDEAEAFIRRHNGTSWDTPKKLAIDNEVVKLTGNQTISGTKTFSSSTYGDALTVSRTTNQGAAIRFNNSDGDMGTLGLEGDGRFSFRSGAGSVPNEVFTVSTSGVLTEGTVPWARLSNVPNFALDNEVVKLTGNQTVSGTKTFTDQVRAWDGGLYPIVMRGTSSQCLLEMVNNNGSRLAYVGANVGRLDFLVNNTTGAFRFRNSNSTAFEFDNSGTMTAGTVPWARLSNVPASLPGFVQRSNTVEESDTPASLRSIGGGGNTTFGIVDRSSNDGIWTWRYNTTLTILGNPGNTDPYGFQLLSRRIGSGALYYRAASSGTDWRSWGQIFTSEHPPAWGDVTSKPNLALDNEVVKLTDDQTITGHKHFDVSPDAGTPGLNVTRVNHAGEESAVIRASMGTSSNSRFLLSLRGGSSSVFSVRGNGDVYFSGTLEEGTVPWARLSGIPVSALRGEISVANIQNPTNSVQGFISGRRFASAFDNRFSAEIGDEIQDYLSSQVWNEVGTYAFLYRWGQGVTPGQTYSGSELRAVGLVHSGQMLNDNGYAVAFTSGGTTLTGTWRAMGRANQASSSTWSRATLFLRIS